MEEAAGLLVRLPAAANPGEIDRAAYLSERGIRGTFHVSSLPGAWQRLESAWYLSAEGLLAVLRGQGQATLLRFLPSETGPLASTLLLGEGAPLEREAWEQYLRTGIVAVLAISGQHLVILGGFLEVLGRCLGWGLRIRSAVIAVLLLGYALLTGGRPPALRAAVVVVLYALAIGLRRPVRAVNLLALAWLLIGVLDPVDLFSPGCQFSFLAVAVLTALPVTRPGEPDDPLNRLVESSDPIVRQVLRDVARLMVRVYVGSALLWLTLAPLALWHYHLLSPVAVLLAPVLTLLATLALLVGFLLLTVGPILPVLAPALVVPLDGILRAMQVIIELGDRCPGGWCYLPTVSSVAVVVFYLGLLLVLALPWVRWRWRLLVPGMCLWLVLVLLWPFRVGPGDELRVTFLAVGHGSSVVLELPDGRVLLYDAGSLRGPGITAQVIAPYLWERGIGRIDEVFLSHADLDHFNGLPALLDRFPVGRVSTTPSFTEKPTPAVVATLRHLEQRGIPIRRLHAGMKLQAGETEIEVLHPPSVGPMGAENLRSLVLRVSRQDRSLLLTGDLEQAGLERVLRLEPRRAEVLMYPHHGSKRVDPVPLVRWAGAKWLIACQGATTNRSDPVLELPQEVRWLNTHQAGAVFCRGTGSGWEVQTFREGAFR